ncbi:MAG: hypothetical protein KC474_00755 [Cyanobacteria bacterium HKST-UBA04]|nr:hypothetical protein [Cyanobacteria bacterium HKST-UBA04]
MERHNSRLNMMKPAAAVFLKKKAIGDHDAQSAGFSSTVRDEATSHHKPKKQSLEQR